MKVRIDIDCTPEEARRFLGLPDLGPVHEIYVEQMRKAMTEGLDADVMTEMMKSWAPVGEAGLAMMTQIFKQGGK